MTRAVVPARGPLAESSCQTGVMVRYLEVTAPEGPGRLAIHSASDGVVAALLLGHGAGGGVDAFDLRALAEALPAAGITVALHEQPWVVAGRRVAGSPATLDRGWLPVLDVVRAAVPGVPLFVGGRSAGARVACRTLPSDASGLVLLSFPLHPPGRPAVSRIDELAAAASDALIVQGERDPFGTPDEVRAACAAVAQAGRRAVVGVPGTHAFEPRSRAARAAASGLASAICEPVVAFAREHLR